MDESLRKLQTEAGARFVEYYEQQTPESYGDTAKEYQTVRETTGLIDWSWRSVIRITGSERMQFLHSMTTNHVLDLQAGKAQHNTSCDVTGHLVGTFRLSNRGEDLWMDMHPGCAEAVLAILDRHLIMEDVQITPQPDWGILSLQGTCWTLALHQVMGVEPPPLEPLDVANWNFSGESLWMIADSHTGEPGVDLFAPRHLLAALWEALNDAARSQEGGPVGLEALRILRVEAGIPWWGEDLDPKVLMLEAGLEDSIHYEKGCYLGQETLARVHFRGHTNRQLAGLEITTAEIPAAGSRLLAEDREAGRITTAVLPPGRQQAIALGFVRRKFLAPGTRLVNADMDAEAVVCSLPFPRHDLTQAFP